MGVTGPGQADAGCLVCGRVRQGVDHTVCGYAGLPAGDERWFVAWFFTGTLGAVTVADGTTTVVRPGVPVDGVGPDLGQVLGRLVAAQDALGGRPQAAGLGVLLRSLSNDVAELVAEVAARRGGEG